MAITVYNDIENNIIVNNRRPKHEKCTLNTPKHEFMVLKNEANILSFALEQNQEWDLLLFLLMLPWRWGSFTCYW